MTEIFLDGAAADTLLDERGLSKLRWRCRRGLLENDLIIESFFEQHAAHLTVAQARGLHQLMDLADNDLLDLLLRRKEPAVETTTIEAIEVLGMLRDRRIRVSSNSPDDGLTTQGN
jgi:antitoxin CptB